VQQQQRSGSLSAFAGGGALGLVKKGANLTAATARHHHSPPPPRDAPPTNPMSEGFLVRWPTYSWGCNTGAAACASKPHSSCCYPRPLVFGILWERKRSATADTQTAAVVVAAGAPPLPPFFFRERNEETGSRFEKVDEAIPAHVRERLFSVGWSRHMLPSKTPPPFSYAVTESCASVKNTLQKKGFPLGQTLGKRWVRAGRARRSGPFWNGQRALAGVGAKEHG